MNVEIRTTKLSEAEYVTEIKNYTFHLPSFLNVEERGVADKEDLYYMYLGNVDRFNAKVRELAKLFSK